MKMKREQLKDLIKECLVEILEDGLGQALTESRVRGPSHLSSPGQQVQPRRQHVPVQRQQSRRFDPSLDTPVRQPQRQQNNHLVEAVMREANGDKVMQDLLADTAARTLPEMMAGDSAPRRSEAHESIGDPTEIFGEASSRWASLAFMSPDNKKAS